MSKQDYVKSFDADAERRFLPTGPGKFITRDDEAGVIIEGYAALFNVRTSLGWFDEIIAPGAFDEVLDDDVRALFNHDPNFVLARSVEGQGTLSLSVDDRGLKYSFVVPNRTYAQDLADAIAAGDISQSSFAFSVDQETWQIAKEGHAENDLRTIEKVRRLYDVAPVTYPAYTDTTVGKRSLAAMKQRVVGEERNGLSVADAQLTINKNRSK